MKVTAVVLNWKRPDDTITCVRSIRETAPDAGVVVVDNASGDGSADAIARAFPDVPLIENEANLGYAGGNNVGIRRALADGADAVFVVNNDVVVQPGCVAALVTAFARERTAGIVGPVSLKRDDPRICDFFTGSLDLRVMALHAPERDRPWGGAPAPQPTGYVTGSAMLIHRDVLGAGDDGAFDERFFLVWEDVDLCLRLGYAGGPRTRCFAVPSASVLHGRSVSFGGEGSPLYQYFYVRNSFLIVREHVRLRYRRRVLRLLERRYRGWLDKPETTPAVGAAIRLGLEHALEGRYGAPPPALLT